MRLRLGIATFLGACLAAAAPASAADYTVGAPVFASPATSPLANPCPYQPNETDAQKNFEDTEVEPQVAINPTDPGNVIGVFQEDRWSDGGAHGLLAAVSMNGG